MSKSLSVIPPTNIVIMTSGMHSILMLALTSLQNSVGKG